MTADFFSPCPMCVTTATGTSANTNDQGRKGECICGEINARHCPVHQEPDAPREWWIDFGLSVSEHHCFANGARFVWAETLEPVLKQLREQYELKAKMYCAERDRADALAKELAALQLYKQGGVLDFASINVELRDQLASAQAEIEQINQEGAEFYIALENELTAARQRIKELEADRAMVTQKWIDQREREQKLVAALERICDYVDKCPDTSASVDCALIARQTLKAHRGEG